MVGQLATAWRDRELATEQDWASANEELKAKRDELNMVVSALHRRRQNGMSAFEAFSRVVADRDRYPEIALGWNKSVRHGPDDIARFRSICREIKIALQAVGQTAGHQLPGLNQTRWTPAWRDEFLANVDPYMAALGSLRERTVAFGESIGIPASSRDPGRVTTLVTLGAYLLKPQAADAVHLISPGRDAVVQALASLAKPVERADKLRTRLSVPYDSRVTRLDLASIGKEWAEAFDSNFLVRSGRKERVRQKLKPYCKGDVPDDIVTDLVLLRDLSEINAQVSRIEPVLSGLDLWNGLDTEVTRFPALRTWADKAEGMVAGLGDSTLSVETLCQHIVMLLTSYRHLFAEGGAARVAYPI